MIVRYSFSLRELVNLTIITIILLCIYSRKAIYSRVDKYCEDPLHESGHYSSNVFSASTVAISKLGSTNLSLLPQHYQIGLCCYLITTYESIYYYFQPFYISLWPVYSISLVFTNIKHMKGLMNGKLKEIGHLIL